MKSVYQQVKLYPEIPATAPIDTDTQTYHLKKIEETEEWNEVKERGNLGKRFNITGWAGPLGAVSAVTSVTGFGAPVGIPLGAIVGVLELFTIPIRRIRQALYIKTAKNEKIKTLAESKLDLWYSL